MDSVDRAWLEMDELHNPMIVSAILEFDGVEDAGRFGEQLVMRLLAQRRFRQHPEASAWVEDPALRLGYHLHIRRLPPGEAPLRAAIAGELASELDRARPLWRMTLFPQRKSRVTLLFRAHHAMADGVSLMQLLLNLADGEESPAVPAPAARARRHGPLDRVIGHLEALNTALESAGEEILDDFRHPEHLTSRLHQARDVAAALARVLALPDDNPRSLRAQPCGRRAVAWAGNLPLAPAKAFAHKHDVTLNDLFLAALAGAFGRYLRSAGEIIGEKQNLRVSVPVNLRTAQDHELGNCFGLVLLDLPVGIEEPQVRLRSVAARMAALKNSPEARAVLGALSLAGQLPVTVEKPLVRLVGGKAAAVVSNLPGPREHMRFAGGRLRRIVFWPPQAARVGVGISLLSYAGHLTFGVSADIAQLPQPQRLVDAFREELSLLVGVPYSPAGRRRHPPQEPRSTP